MQLIQHSVLSVLNFSCSATCEKSCSHNLYFLVVASGYWCAICLLGASAAKCARCHLLRNFQKIPDPCNNDEEANVLDSSTTDEWRNLDRVYSCTVSNIERAVTVWPSQPHSVPGQNAMPKRQCRCLSQVWTGRRLICMPNEKIVL